MAPKLYEEEYNELAGIYSFETCMLEMITCEYPNSECKSPAQIFKKVTMGIKPASLCKANDPLVKQFIEKCLVPASMRLPAIELLKDPFLATENSKELISSHLKVSNRVPRLENLLHSESNPMEIDNCFKKFSTGSCTKGNGQAQQESALECRARNIHFTFYVNSDTSFSIAEEMVEQLDLSSEDVAVIAELIDGLIVKLFPISNPSLGSTLRVSNGSCGVQQNDACKAASRHDIVLLTQESANSDISAEFNMANTSEPNTSTLLWSSNHSLELDAYTSSSDFGMHDSGILKLHSFLKSSGIFFMDLCCEMSKNMSLSDICSLSLADKDQQDELKLEFDVINSHYGQCFIELSRMRVEATENAKKHWMMKKNVFVS